MRGEWWAEPAELQLSQEPEAVRLARRFVAARVPVESLRDDAQLVASELIANAFQHGLPPVTVRVLADEERARIEVQDASPRAPVRSLASEQNMTGRGLTLIDQISDRWGVRAERGGGKSVWAELTVTGEGATVDDSDVDALLAAWGDEGVTGEERFAVSVGDVPTDLLIAAKAHIDNLVREFTLASSGAVSSGIEVPPHLASLIETVVHGFGDARAAIKRQALASADRGDRRTRLTLNLPLSAANAGEAYLAALDEADDYARAARLLTLETPPQHRIFRRWYVESVVDQLRRIARGEPVGVPITFEERLLEEVARLSVVQRATQRSARLQSATAALAVTSTPEDVAAVVVSEGVSALRASGGSLLVLAQDGIHLTVPGAIGYRSELISHLMSENRDAPLPAAMALRTSEPVWLESRYERDERFPALTGLEPETIAMCAVPLIAGDHALGALRFSFETPRLFDAEERQFIMALAAQTAHALERSALNAAERAARAAAEALATRLAGLAGVSAKLAAASDIATVADVVVSEAADALGAQVASLFILEGERLEAAAMRGVLAESQRRWGVHPLSSDLPAAEALRTGQTISVAGRDAIEARWPGLAGEVPEDRSLVCVPMFTEGRPTGVISLMFPGQQLPDAHESTFLAALADTCAHALHRLTVTAAADHAASRLQLIADASAALTSSLDYRATLARVARLVIPRLGDWCAIEMLDDSGTLQTLVVEHVDPEKVALAVELQRRYPANMDATVGSPNVARTGRSELIAEITDEMLIAGTRDDEHLELSRQLGLRSALVVPLVARGRVLGTLTLIYAESDRRYSESDLPFAAELGQRAATAIDNARLFSQTQEVAIRLQRALLPDVVPPLPGFDIAAHYSPSGEQAQVGGDWYDIVPLRDGRFVAVVGDVMGRGVAAAAAMAQMRATIRGFATVDPDPAVVLGKLDLMFDELDMQQLVTVLYILVDTDTGEMSMASAGHLPPILLQPDREPESLTLPIGLPLGVGIEDRVGVTMPLPPASSLVVYTDGLVERRDRDLDIHELLSTAGASAEQSAQELLTALTEAAGVSVSHDDDVTALVVRRT